MILKFYLSIVSELPYVVSSNLHKLVFMTSGMQLHQNFKEPLKIGHLYKTDTLASPKECLSKEALLYVTFSWRNSVT